MSLRRRQRRGFCQRRGTVVGKCGVGGQEDSMLQGGTRLNNVCPLSELNSRFRIDVEKSCNQSAGTQASSLQCGKVHGG